MKRQDSQVFSMSFLDIMSCGFGALVLILLISQFKTYDSNNTDASEKILETLQTIDLLELEIIDEIIAEPVGGAHRDKELILENVRDSISKNLNSYNEMSPQEIFENRKNKFLRIGRNKGFISNLDEISSLKPQIQNFNQIFKSKKTIILTALVVTLLISSLFILL